MALITKPVTLTNGQVAQATDVESDFTTIYNDYNGNITTANLAAGAGIEDTKLNQISTANKVAGTALTTLATISSAAGIIPSVNLGGGTTAGTRVLQSNGTWLASNTSSGVVVFDANQAYPPGDATNLINVPIGKTICRAWLATSATLGGAGYTKILLNRVTTDTHAGFDTANSWYITPSAGPYKIFANVNAVVANTNYFSTSIYINGATKANTFTYGPAAGNTFSMLVTDIQNLATGTTIDVRSHGQAGSTDTSVGAESDTYLWIEKLA